MDLTANVNSLKIPAYPMLLTYSLYNYFCELFGKSFSEVWIKINNKMYSLIFYEVLQFEMLWPAKRVASYTAYVSTFHTL